MVITHSKKQSQRPANYRLVSLIMGIVAGGMLLAGAIWGGYNYLFIRQAETATGVVTDLIPVGRLGKGYYPQVQFTTLAGEEITYQPLSSQNPPAFAIGEQVTVYYDPANPERAKLDWFVNLWLGPMLLAMAGAIDVIVASVFFVLHLKKKQQQSVTPGVTIA